jgi:hypothetical protein
MLTENGVITALLDWEMTSRGHPGEDVGAARWSVLGFADPLAVDAGYADIADAPPSSECAWFEVLVHLVRAGQALDGTLAFIRGKTDESTLPAMGLGLVTANLLRAAHRAWHTPLDPAPVDVAAPATTNGAMIERLESVIRQLTSTDDARGVARRRIAEVVHAAYASGADVRDDRMLREVAAASLGVDVRTHDELLLTLRSNAARVSTNAPLCDALLNDVAARRARMGALLAHFGQTTSTSVAR